MLKARELWKDEGEWHWQQLDNVLPLASIQKLRALKFRSSELFEDRFGWLEPNNGLFKVKESESG